MTPFEKEVPNSGQESAWDYQGPLCGDANRVDLYLAALAVAV